MGNDKYLNSSRFGQQPPFDASKLNKWRVALFDAVKGVVVLDVNATTEADAKGVADRIATEKLDCKQITAATAICHAVMPVQWTKNEEQFVVPQTGLEQPRVDVPLTELLQARKAEPKLLKD